MSNSHNIERENELGQAIGEPLDGWRSPSAPPGAVIRGQRCVLEPLDVKRHGSELYAAFSEDTDGGNWTYLGYGPFADEASCVDWVRSVSSGADPKFYAIIDSASGAAVGVGSYLRIDPANGCIEVGHLHFSPRLQRNPVATEAMYLMMKHVFELGYRRYEWKCDSRNAPSRRAAQRFGFSFEGIFRQATFYKSRNRDTAWYAIIDKDWPLIEAAYERWLAAQNFDDERQQRESLSALTRPLLNNLKT